MGKSKAKVAVSARFCKGCMLCVEVCPKKSLVRGKTLSEAGVEVVCWQDESGCTGCMMCALMCPDAAITVEHL